MRTYLNTANWKRKCNGRNGGTSVECSATKGGVNGKCSKEEPGKCLVGNHTNFGHRYISNASGKLKCANGGTAKDLSSDIWSCVGSGGGKVANCTYTIEDPCEEAEDIKQI